VSKSTSKKKLKTKIETPEAPKVFEPYSLDFTLPELPGTQADVLQMRARSAERKRWHEMVYWAVLEAGGRPKSPITRASIFGYRHSSQRPDTINLYFSFKAIVDGLIVAKVIDDDNPKVLVDEGYFWRPAAPNHGFVSVSLRSLPETEC
jgi:hypothetical protein